MTVAHTLQVLDHDADSVRFQKGSLSGSASRDQVEASAFWEGSGSVLDGVRLTGREVEELLASMDSTDGCHDCARTIAGGPCPGHKARWSE